MTSELRTALEDELTHAEQLRRSGDLRGAFRHLERAHILSQRYTGPHVRVHVAMLQVGWARMDLREIVGQLTRILAAALFSRIWVPIGNTGGANVSALRPMPVPYDLAPLLGRSVSGRTLSGNGR
jgi:hypothetical protein